MTLSFGDRPVEAVVFDLDDVLVPFQTVRAWQWAWRPQGPVLGERKVGSVLRTRLRAWDRRRWQGVTGQAPPVGVDSFKEHLAETLRALAGHTVPVEESEAVVRRFLRPAGEIERYADAVPTLARLEASSVKVGVLTHLAAEPAAWILRRAGIPERYLLGTGGAEGPMLPDAGAFRGACERLGVAAGRTVFVGDLLWSDVHAAHRAGLLPILLDRHDAWPDVQADRTPSLGALEERLRAGPFGTGPDGAPPPPPS